MITPKMTVQEVYPDLTVETLMATLSIDRERAKEMLRATKLSCPNIKRLNEPWLTPPPKEKSLPKFDEETRIMYYGKRRWKLHPSQPGIEHGIEAILEDLFSTANLHILRSRSPWYDPNDPMANIWLSKVIYARLKKFFREDYDYFDQRFFDDSPPSSKCVELDPRLAAALERKLRGEKLLDGLPPY